ncbi:chemotaxis protein CheA [Duganella caerulea]|uniref:chemotaxis protein CheA n=1 Tax=Duganella caerulea TaxID=2885762 RepID=UPI0030E8E8B3
MFLDQALPTFIAESRELLDAMESALLQFALAAPQEDTVNAVFRAAHTIKGSAGLFGLDHIVGFTHVVESVLDRVREGTVPVAEPLVTLLLSCADHIRALIDTTAAGQYEPNAASTATGSALLERLQRHLPGALAAAEPAQGAETAVAAIAADAGANNYWHLSLRFGSEVFKNGMDPLSFLRYLGQLGTIVGLETLADALPPADAMDPHLCYLGFEVSFDSTADKAAIEDVFDFVREDAQIRILPPHSRVADYLRLIAELPEQAPRLGEILVRCGSVTAQELAEALAAQAAAATPQPLGSIMVAQGVVPPVVVEAALAQQQQLRGKGQETQTVRVDAEKLDQLINLVGELIIASAGASLTARRAGDAALQESASAVSELVEQVRDRALQLRMVRIGATFGRFQRVVHDVAREIGKDIRLQLSGEDTELDKTVVEKLGDPLTHLVRNAIDHGIEAAALRLERGKPAQGTVRLHAYHDAGNIVIEVSDDGGGLRREKILAKAEARGLIEPGQNLSDAEIYNLVFEPGFSTAEQVTNLSGRGVGMDVVKRNIVALRGSVALTSTEGVGTAVSVRLPLTLAMIDGFLVSVGKAPFVVPLEMIEECIEYSAAPGHHYTDLRGEVLPFVRLRDVFALDGAVARRQSIVVVRQGGVKAGLVVDALHGEFQTVIKPLDKMFQRADRLSGSTILGTGEVALILDVPALIRQATASAPTAPTQFSCTN